MFAKMNKKERLWFFLVILLAILIIFFPYFFMGRKYFNSYDTLNQHIPFFTEFRNKVYNGESLFWSHNIMFGGSFLTGKAFYLTTDIFSYVFLLFPFLEVVDALFVLQIIKSIISYIGMYRFLDEFDFSFKTKITCSLAYTFSSWIFLFYGMQSFISFATLLPFFFTGIEHYLKNNKTTEVFCLSLLLICSNYYLFYSLSIFLVFYWIVRYLIYNDSEFDIKHFFKKTIILIITYLLGVGVSAPIMISVVYEMLHNTRVVYSGTTGFLWDSFNVYLNLFIKFVSSPLYVSKSYDTVLQTNMYRIDQIGLFVSSFFCLTLPQLFIICKKKNKKILIASILLIILFLFTQFGCSMFHGFSEPSFRWTLFLVFVSCILMAFLLENISKININLLFACLVVYVLLSIIIIIYSGMYKNATLQFITVIISLLIMALYFVLIIKNYKHIYLIIIIEILVQGFFSNYLWGDRFQNSYKYDFIPNNYFDKMNDPNEFYRVWVSNYYVDMDYESDFNFNANLVLGYKGLYTYDSAYQASMSGLMRSFDQLYHWYELPYDGIMTVTSTKYYVAKTIEEIPNPNVEFVERIGDSNYNLYLNKDYRLFGYTNNNICSFQDWSYEDIFVKDALIKDYLIINDNDIEENNLNNLKSAQSHHLTNLYYTSNTLEGDIETTNDELLFLSIPFDRGWNIKCDGKVIKKIYTNGGFMSALIPKGQHHIQMVYKPFGFNIGCVLSVISLILFLVLKKENNIKNNYLKK